MCLNLTEQKMGFAELVCEDSNAEGLQARLDPETQAPLAAASCLCLSLTPIPSPSSSVFRDCHYVIPSGRGAECPLHTQTSPNKRPPALSLPALVQRLSEQVSLRGDGASQSRLSLLGSSQDKVPKRLMYCVNIRYFCLLRDQLHRSWRLPQDRAFHLLYHH